MMCKSVAFSGIGEKRIFFGPFEIGDVLTKVIIVASGAGPLSWAGAMFNSKPADVAAEFAAGVQLVDVLSTTLHGTAPAQPLLVNTVLEIPLGITIDQQQWIGFSLHLQFAPDFYSVYLDNVKGLAR